MRSSLLVLGFVVLLTLAALLGYGAWYRVIAEESREAAALADAILEKSRSVDRIALTKATLAKNSDLIDRVFGYTLSQAEVVSFIELLEGIAGKQNAALEVASVAVDPAKDRPALSFALSIEGSFDAVLATLGAIEYAPYTLSFQSVTLAKNAQRSGWHAEVRLRVMARP